MRKCTHRYAQTIVEWKMNGLVVMKCAVCGKEFERPPNPRLSRAEGIAAVFVIGGTFLWILTLIGEALCVF